MFGLQDYMQLEGLALRVVPLKNPSDKRYSVMGNGKVATDIFYDNVENKFNWGNFGQERPFCQSQLAQVCRVTGLPS
ncbi:MAG: hypothetical protein R2784_07055 [Saprospiraceae bacterium]